MTIYGYILPGAVGLASASWVNSNEQYLNGLVYEKSNIIDFMNVVENLTPQRVNEVLREYIKPGNAYLAFCGRNSADMPMAY